MFQVPECPELDMLSLSENRVPTLSRYESYLDDINDLDGEQPPTVKVTWSLS
jgi:hypothetical protein